MLNEPFINPRKAGWIEVVCGGMFSGKTEEIIRRCRRAVIAGQRVIIIKPAFDNRYSESEIVSHNKNTLKSVLADNTEQIIELAADAQVVCIDEAQFFNNTLVDIANKLANNGKRVIIAGLDMDFEGRPFEPVPQLLAIAEYITKLHAICSKSGMIASYSQRLNENKDRVLLGEKEVYEPRARHCFKPFQVKNK